ncbi:TetR/AcrR family transcriptional regulator [uncultured Devosia sp.]|uniref:TetR/AcrR family transcriptional regulator n=1 Tax=uncultured Devosia sp. TaxID=211434 RepID=UPI0035CABF11
MRAGDTKAQILDVALALFNEGGSGNVSTNQIAEAAGRSPGNLYYHFRSKEEIVRHLLDRLIARWAQIYALPGDRMPTMADLETMVAANFGALWDYRFIYRDLEGLRQRDPVFAKTYAQTRQAGFVNFRLLLLAFVGAGILQAPGSDTETEELAQLLWIVGDYWLAFVEAGGQPVTQAQIDHGSALFRRVLKPYVRTSK